MFYHSLQKYVLRFCVFIPSSPNTLTHLNSYVKRQGKKNPVKFSLKQIILLGEVLPKKMKILGCLLGFFFCFFVVSAQSVFRFLTEVTNKKWWCMHILHK